MLCGAVHTPVHYIFGDEDKLHREWQLEYRFRSTNPTMAQYLEIVELYFEANKVKEELQVPMLHWTYARLSEIMAPTKPGTKSFTDLKEL